jgi:hypothetical protein
MLKYQKSSPKIDRDVQTFHNLESVHHDVIGLGKSINFSIGIS